MRRCEGAADRKQMLKIIEYYGRAQDVRATMRRLPGWARFLVGIVALPGIILVGLSILAFVVSILALLVLTVPVYRLLAALTGTAGRVEMPAFSEEQAGVVIEDSQAEPTTARRHVDVTIIE